MRVQLSKRIAGGIAPALTLIGCWLGWATGAEAGLPLANPPTPTSVAASERATRTSSWSGDKALFGLKIRAIEHIGLRRTITKVVARELLIAAGEPLARGKLVESVQRLRNLRIFRMVRAHISAQGDGVRVRFDYDEKWTLLPVFTAGRGGGRLFLIAGLTDINTLGRLIETGGTYTYFAGTDSYTVQISDPRLLDRRVHLGLLTQVGARNRYEYRRDGALQRVYSRHRKWFAAGLTDLRNPKRVAALTVDVVSDAFDKTLLSDAEAATSADFAAPMDNRHVLVGASYRWGRIDLDDYVEGGGYLKVGATASIPQLGTTDGYIGADVSAKLAVQLPYRQNIVLRANAGAKSASYPEFRYYVGGLRYARGFFEGRFAGAKMWSTNAEYRAPSVHHRLVVLQHVLFCDMAAAADRAADLGRFGVSFGTGGRLILPLIAQFVARLDFAWFVEPNRRFDPAHDWRVSFGSQQFF